PMSSSEPSAGFRDASSCSPSVDNPLDHTQDSARRKPRTPIAARIRGRLSSPLWLINGSRTLTPKLQSQSSSSGSTSASTARISRSAALRSPLKHSSRKSSHAGPMGSSRISRRSARSSSEAIDPPTLPAPPWGRACTGSAPLVRVGSLVETEQRVILKHEERHARLDTSIQHLLSVAVPSQEGHHGGHRREHNQQEGQVEEARE